MLSLTSMWTIINNSQLGWFYTENIMYLTSNELNFKHVKFIGMNYKLALKKRKKGFQLTAHFVINSSIVRD